MKSGKNVGFTLITVCIFALIAFLTVFVSVYNKMVFAVSVSALVLILLLWIVLSRHFRTSVAKSISTAAEKMCGEDTKALDCAVSPVIVTDKFSDIVWCNKAFRNTVCSDSKIIGKPLNCIIDGDAYDKLLHFKNAEIVLNDKIYKAFTVGEDTTVIYFTDETVLKKTAAEYRFSRPVAAVLEIDSLDEALKGAKDSKRAQIISELQDIIEKWFSHAGGIMRKLSDSRFFLLFEQRYLTGFEQERFSVIETVRNFELDGYNHFTLSVGVGYGGSTLHECESLAFQAMDMALSRGGDQAAVKSPNEDYRFYGGVKAVAEKGSRVRTRVTAQAIKELINGADRVIVMGHRYSDLDCVGAALGFCAIADSLQAPVNIAVNKQSTMAGQLIDYVCLNGLGHLFIDEKQALSLMSPQTLLVVVDTHRPSFTDFPTVCEESQKTVVIDHHRKATDYIKNAILFYNETVCSSTCEIITEFWQYAGAGNIGRVYANALLSGIMLDTKNFVLNTGVRTYEAAAYLRRCGAEPITVKKMFADSMEIEKAKYAVISTARIFDDCAVAFCNSDINNARVAAVQAADELLGVENVKASFVLYESGGYVNISARSYGEINVQLIMEKMGGGGHRTMSAASLKGYTFETAFAELQLKIKEYKEER